MRMRGTRLSWRRNGRISQALTAASSKRRQIATAIRGGTGFHLMSGERNRPKRMTVSAPLGQYDSSKLLNLGNNRWSFKPELGISKAVGPWTFELAPSVTIFTDNTNFFGGNNFVQAPFYAVQGHILYTFQSGAWFALDGVYFSGGRTSLNGVKSDNEQRNTRAGFTVALPIDRQNSLKLSASTGITSRTGSEFTAVGVAWQYRWGDGY
jgi:hypothetical protein